VLFNGMEKTSHWAALYFVALMTFGNYVLFNLLVAILVEGFSAEVNIAFVHSPKSNAAIRLLTYIYKYILETYFSISLSTCTGFFLLHNLHPLLTYIYTLSTNFDTSRDTVGLNFFVELHWKLSLSLIFF